MTSVAASRPSPVAVWAGFSADVLLAIGLMLVLSLGAGVVWALLAAPSGNAGISAVAQVVMAVISTGGTAGVLYLTRRRADQSEMQASLAALKQSSTWLWAVGCGVMVFVATQLFTVLAGQWLALPQPSNVSLMKDLLSGSTLILVMFAVVLAPAYEELLFRRVLFGRLATAGKVWQGVLASSLLFAVVHEIPGLGANGWLASLQLWIVYGGLGAAFAWIYHRTGTLLAPILAHSINNALALALLVWGSHGT